MDDPGGPRCTQLTLPDAAHYEDLGSREQQLARMLFFTLWPDKGFDSYQAGLDHLRAHPAVCVEVRELLAMGADWSRRIPLPLGRGIAGHSALSHARYRRGGDLAAGLGLVEKVRAGHATGWCGRPPREPTRLVNIRKSEGGVLARVPRLRDLAGPLPLSPQNATRWIR